MGLEGMDSGREHRMNTPPDVRMEGGFDQVHTIRDAEYQMMLDDRIGDRITNHARLNELLEDRTLLEPIIQDFGQDYTPSMITAFIRRVQKEGTTLH